MHKHFRALAAFACVALMSTACAKSSDDTKPGSADTPSDLTTDAQKFGYSIGIDLGRSLGPVKDDVDVKALEMGLEEAAAGKTPRLDDKAREDIKKAVSVKIQQKQLEDRQAKAEKAKTDGAAFLAENGKKDGVKTTASGLQYEVLTEGKGDHPTKDDKVTVNYKGTLTDGTVFDSSYDRGQPVTFPLANVIPGWTEGLQLMTPGSKYKLYLPSSLAYGEHGAGAKIGPNETLIFEVELISVDKGGAAPAPADAAAGKKGK